MTRCPNCNKLSKDDDFCSHCGAAVYGDDGDFRVPTALLMNRDIPTKIRATALPTPRTLRAA